MRRGKLRGSVPCPRKRKWRQEIFLLPPPRDSSGRTAWREHHRRSRRERGTIGALYKAECHTPVGCEHPGARPSPFRLCHPGRNIWRVGPAPAPNGSGRSVGGCSAVRKSTGISSRLLKKIHSTRFGFTIPGEETTFKFARGGAVPIRLTHGEIRHHWRKTSP